ncbi:ankyrin repeat domain-containing protein, partial [Lactiplantibacillus plantarum]
NLKDGFGKSCLDYAKEYSWRNDFLDIVKEYENSKK